MNEAAYVAATVFGLIILGLLIWSLVWVYRDAQARGRSGGLIALLVCLISWPLGLLIWLAARPDLDPSS